MIINTDKPMEQVILETAEHMFLESGFAAVSTTQIARKCGCNQALVHYYYRTKDNLFNTIFENKFRLFFRSVFESKDISELTFTQKLEYIIESHFEILQKNPRLPVLIISELTRRPEQIAVLRDKLELLPKKIFSDLENELNVEISKGNIRNITFPNLLITMVSLNVAVFVMKPVIETVMQLNNEQSKAFIEHRRKEHVDFVLNGILLKK